ncbi:MAG: ATP-binding protein, partial [Clostridia bacterium]|nr:ATP-binding protein [Clostridia bacterium]
MSELSGTPINSIKLTLPSLSVNEGIARSVIASFCAHLGPTTTDIADIKCAVSEAVTNCIVHAYKNTVGMIYITAEAFPNSVV